jgi:hypothetical protein
VVEDVWQELGLLCDAGSGVLHNRQGNGIRLRLLLLLLAAEKGQVTRKHDVSEPLSTSKLQRHQLS